MSDIIERDYRSVGEIEADIRRAQARLDAMDRRYRGNTFPASARAEWNTLNAQVDSDQARLDELRVRDERLRELAENPATREDTTSAPSSTRSPRGDIWDLTTVSRAFMDPGGEVRDLRDRAMRAIEGAHFAHDRANREDAQEHIEGLLQGFDDESNQRASHVARRILLTGSPLYQRAFAKTVAGRPVDAEEQRALSVGVGADGGFAVPFTLDPTIVPTSNHSVNPYRAISRVETIAGTNEWRGVTSAGVSASRAAEAAEAADDSPTLEQPAIKVERVQAFIPFSHEVGQDWGSLQSEMATLLQDAKDDEEAASFTTGDGVAPNAQGVLTGATTLVDTAAVGAFASSDVYALEEALPPRFRPRASFVANRAIYNKIRQFDTQGGAQLWLYLAQGLANQVPTPGNTGAQLLGYPANEASAMAAGVVADAKILVLGDFRYYVIVERVGMEVELVQHLFGANRRPTGQRGLYAIWRNNAKVLSANAFRVLQVEDA